jgi:uncharacterized protein
VRFEDGVLHLRVMAPPVEGRANAAVIAVLSGFLGIPKTRLSILRGGRGRQKVVEIEGMKDEELAAAMGEAFSRNRQTPESC